MVVPMQATVQQSTEETSAASIVEFYQSFVTIFSDKTILNLSESVYQPTI